MSCPHLDLKQASPEDETQLGTPKGRLAVGCSLPERIRPAFCAFGGVTDGFLPFELPSGESFKVELASVVMKAVQAHVPGAAAAHELAMPSAGKLGDDANLAKAQVRKSQT